MKFEWFGDGVGCVGENLMNWVCVGWDISLIYDCVGGIVKRRVILGV